ncbi:MAG TPA: hypothetical protein VHO70_22440 [Chitinispirillaceae bacterium]|nr:hypothetical protein [Chitinispirillaceae bacterium]
MIRDKNISDLNYNRKYYFLFLRLILFGLLSLFITVISMDENTRITLVRENGPIENLTATYYFIVVFIMFVKGGWKYLRNYTHLAVLVSVLGFRELDFNARFTTMSIWKIKFYLSAHVPLAEKIIGILVTVIILYFVIVCIKKHLRSFLAGCTRETESILVGISLLFMAMAFILDKMPDPLVNLGKGISSQFAQSMEEILELGVPLVLILSALSYFSSHPSGGSSLPLSGKKAVSSSNGDN